AVLYAPSLHDALPIWIHFAFAASDASGSRIDAADALTDGDGVASVQFIAGSPASLRLVASADGLGASPVTFTLDVVPLRRALQRSEEHTSELQSHLNI